VSQKTEAVERVRVYQLRQKYLKTEYMPTVWCPGCGIGSVLQYTIRAIDELGFKPEDIVWVSGIGCAGRTFTYVNFDSVHILHGRTPAIATGLKMANPNLKVIIFTGDGDAVGIGGNHFIHAARRNLDVTMIICNNFNFGMTGGQYGPSTPKGSITQTSPYGNPETPMDIASLAVAAGANYVARWTVFHYVQGINSLKKALSKKGFSVVEFLTPCPTNWGRRNNLEDSVKIIKWYQEHVVPISQAQKMTPEELADKIIIGEFVDRDRPGFYEEYLKLINAARKKMGWE